MESLNHLAAGLTDQGLQRSHNEDALYLSPARDLFLVADGMGGHAGGEVASATIVEVVTAGAEQVSQWNDVPTGLRRLLAEADQAVRRLAAGHLTGMGSTVVSLYLRDNRYWTAHAGDSRAYLWRAGDLERLTQDHTPELNMTGLAPGVRRSGIITRAVGIGPATQFDVGTGQTWPGDRFLLCSDGLTDAVEDTELTSLLGASSEPATVARELIAAANAAGGPDNITALVVFVAADG